MLLSFASSSETSLLGLLAEILSDAQLAFRDLPKWERVVHIFWLLGPFILLIERTPADLWLSLLGLFFPIQSTADFFGQWNNIFMWSAVVLSMAVINLAPADK